MASPYWNNGNDRFYPIGYNKNPNNNVTFRFCETMAGKDIEFSTGMILSTRLNMIFNIYKFKITYYRFLEDICSNFNSRLSLPRKYYVII